MKLKELKQLREHYSKSSKETLIDFDKNFFWVTTGLFAFTVTFIKDIVNIKSAHWVIFLLISWLFFAFAIGFIILSYYLSAIDEGVIFNRLEHIISQYPDEENLEVKTPKLAEDEAWKFNCRFLSILAFLCGILSLGIFLTINFYWGNDEISADKKKPQTENPLVPSKDNPVAPINHPVDTTIRHTDSTIILKKDSTFLIIKPDTLFIKAASGDCSCPPGSHVCTKKCHRKSVAR